MTDEPRRYYYVVWREGSYICSGVADGHPADWLAQKIEDHKKSNWFFRTAKPPQIINQFEITAEQYNRLEILQ